MNKIILIIPIIICKTQFSVKLYTNNKFNREKILVNTIGNINTKNLFITPSISNNKPSASQSALTRHKL